MVLGFVFVWFEFRPKQEASQATIYTIQDFDVSFTLPLGWSAKPYPNSSSTIFLSPADFEFPGAWEGPLTPITIMVEKNSKILNEANQALVKDEPSLKIENTEYKGYKALRITGVPIDTPYLSGRYYDSFSIQRGNDVIRLDSFGVDSNPRYEQELKAIIQSLDI